MDDDLQLSEASYDQIVAELKSRYRGVFVGVTREHRDGVSDGRIMDYQHPVEALGIVNLADSLLRNSLLEKYEGLDSEDV